MTWEQLLKEEDQLLAYIHNAMNESWLGWERLKRANYFLIGIGVCAIAASVFESFVDLWGGLAVVFGIVLWRQIKRNQYDFHCELQKSMARSLARREIIISMMAMESEGEEWKE